MFIECICYTVKILYWRTGSFSFYPVTAFYPGNCFYSQYIKLFKHIGVFFCIFWRALTCFIGACLWMASITNCFINEIHHRDIFFMLLYYFLQRKSWNWHSAKTIREVYKVFSWRFKSHWILWIYGKVFYLFMLNYTPSVHICVIID
jgi:hypothetical protein